MKNILALTDFSSGSTNAIKYALKLFEGNSLDFYILHCKVPDSTYTTAEVVASGNASFYDSLLKEAQEKLDNLIADLKQDFGSKSISFHPIVSYNSLIDAVKNVIETKNIHLSVMGTNGVTNAKEAVFGSNTVKMIKQITHPILAVPIDFNFSKLKNIVLPLHDFDKLNDNSFEGIVSFIKKFSITVHALRISPMEEVLLDAKNDEKALKTLLGAVKFNYHTVRNVPLNYVVDCFIQTHDIDMVLLLEKSEGILKRFFSNSSTTKIANDMRVPLLAFPN